MSVDPDSPSLHPRYCNGLGRLGTIYKLTSPTGKSYVGQTIQQLSKRIGGHRCKSTCYAIHAAIKKYGFRSFDVAVLAENVPSHEIDDVEDYFIAHHDTLAPNGYNLVRGRRCRDKEQQYQNLSDAMKRVCALDDFVQKKKDLWSDPVWAAAWRQTWMEKREDALEKLDGREKELRVLGNKRNDRRVARRKALKSSDAAAEWDANYSNEAVMQRRNQKNHIARIEKMKSMSDIDAAAYIANATRKALNSGSGRGRTEADVHCWFPNVLTMEEIGRLRANGGVWAT